MKFVQDKKLKDYLEWKYLYPPRPEASLTADRLPYYEKEGWWGQYKKNGTCSIDGFSPTGLFHSMNRHAEPHRAWRMTDRVKEVLASFFPRKSWTVVVLEILHSKTPTIKDTVYIHDLLVLESQYLLGTTFDYRQSLLEQLLPSSVLTKSHYVIDQNVWRARNIKKDFLKHFTEIIDPKIDEGLVLKNPQGTLKRCSSPGSNSGWQLKFRYPTKNYQF